MTMDFTVLCSSFCFFLEPTCGLSSQEVQLVHILRGLESLQQLHSEGKQFAHEKAFPATPVLTQALCGQKSFYLVTILNP